MNTSVQNAEQVFAEAMTLTDPVRRRAAVLNGIIGNGKRTLP